MPGTWCTGTHDVTQKGQHTGVQPCVHRPPEQLCMHPSGPCAHTTTRQLPPPRQDQHVAVRSAAATPTTTTRSASNPPTTLLKKTQESTLQGAPAATTERMLLLLLLCHARHCACTSMPAMLTAASAHEEMPPASRSAATTPLSTHDSLRRTQQHTRPPTLPHSQPVHARATTTAPAHARPHAVLVSGSIAVLTPARYNCCM
jgi:hypothetical protein